MRTCEEFYEYVVKRCDDIRIERRKKRVMLSSIAVSACGVFAFLGVVLGTVYHTNNEEYVPQSVPGNGIDYSASTDNTPPSYTLNIGEIKMSEGGAYNFFAVGMFQERTREETLDHFGLSSDFELPNLHEVPPPGTITGVKGKYGYTIEFGYDGDTKSEWVVDPRYDYQVFGFENTDGSKWVHVAICNTDCVPWWINWVDNLEEINDLPLSEIAGAKMRIAKRNVGGYYAEFDAKHLCVGVTAMGCSEEELVVVLEYLARYTGVADTERAADVSVGTVDNIPDGVFF